MVKKALLIFLVMLAGSVVGQAQMLGTDCEPYGSISIQGEPAADNIPVVAYISGHEFARGVTLGGQYSLIIPMDNVDTGDKEGWAEGDIIVIKVNGTEASPSLAAQEGRVRHDLTINALSVKLDTWGKIKALFK